LCDDINNSFGKLGNAKVRVCDTVKMTKIIKEMLMLDPDLFSDNEPLTSEFVY